MKLYGKWLAILLLALALPLSGCGFYKKLRARDALNRGVKAFTEQKYEEAAKFFEESIASDPEFKIARTYLATTYTSQFVPGSPDPRSNEMAQKAIQTFNGYTLANRPLKVNLARPREERSFGGGGGYGDRRGGGGGGYNRGGPGGNRGGPGGPGGKSRGGQKRY